MNAIVRTGCFRHALLLAVALAAAVSTGGLVAADPIGPQGGALTTYPDLPAFLAATGGIALQFEDFGFRDPLNTSPCFEPLNREAGGPATSFRSPNCFNYQSGNVVEGFSIRTNTDWNPGAGGGGSDWAPPGGPAMFASGTGAGDVLVGAGFGGASATYVDFTGQPTAVSMDVYDNLAGSPITVDVYDTGGMLLDSLMLIPTAPGNASFAGFTSLVPIGRVAVHSASSAAQMVANLRFGGGPGQLVVDTSDLDFGSAAIGTGTQRLLQVQNQGDLDLTVDSLPALPTPFLLIDDGCSGTTLPPDGTCDVEIGFEPLLERRFAAVLSIGSDVAHAQAEEVTLRGRGVVPVLTAAPTAIDFGEVAVGEVGGPESAVLVNLTAVPLNVAAIGAIGSPFAANGGDCSVPPFALAPGASCTLAFTFNPAAEGTFQSHVAIESDAPASPQVILLRGGTGDAIFADGFDP